MNGETRVPTRAGQRSLRALVASVSASTMLLAGLPLPAHAALVGTSQTLAPSAGESRARLDSWLARKDVAQVLQQQGISATEAHERVAALSDAEAERLANRLDQTPAGGDILGIVFTVFVILLITDILGLTKVFPFTRPIR
jgi:hypothetical protein